VRYLVNLDQLCVIPRFRVTGDRPVGHNISVDAGKPVLVELNPQGAVSAKKQNLGLKPGEFDFVCQWCNGETNLVDYGNQTRWTIAPKDAKDRVDRVILTREFLDDKPELAWFWRVYKRAPVKPRPRPDPYRDPMRISCKYGGSF